MTPATGKLLLVAALAGGLGLLASVWWGGRSSLLLRSETGQRVLQSALDATAADPPAGVVPARPGDPMPAIALPGLDGKIVDLAANYPGRPLLINVWASWCGPCIEEMPELQRFAGRQAEHGVQVIGLALDEATAVRQFLQQVPVDYPIVLDQPGPADASVWLGNRKGVLPYSVLVGANGRIVKQKVGPFAAGEIGEWAANAP